MEIVIFKRELYRVKRHTACYALKLVMMSSRKSLCFLACAAAVPLLLLAQDKVDLSIVNRIKAEAFENSKVMDHMFYLTDVHGPRLTGSPGYKEAGDWVVSRLTEYGLANVKEEKWGPFGRGWTCRHFEGHMLEPQYSSLIGFPLAWSAGTEGAVSGEAVQVSIENEKDFEKYQGKLKGKIVLSQPLKEVAFQTNPLGRRYTDAELASEILAPEPGHNAFGPRPPQAGSAAIPADPEERRKMMEARAKFQDKVAQFYKDEGALVILSYGYNGDGGTVFASSARNAQDPKKPISLPSVALTPEHYNRMVRLINHKIPVKLEFNIRNEFFNDNQDSFNVVGEIPGNGKRDEVVMLGAHLDSWHGGTGATDNAAGSSVAMEAIRILKTLDLKDGPDRAGRPVGRRRRRTPRVESIC